MTDKKYYKWVVPTILVAGLLVGLVFSFQPAQAVNTAPGSVEASSAEVGRAPTATGPVCTTTVITDATIAYWNLDEVNVTTFDDSITTNDGTCDGDTCPEYIPGTTAGGQFFIETDKDVITVASSTEFDLTATSDFSVGAWVKTTQDCSGRKVFIGRYHKTNGSWWIGCVPEEGDTGVGFAAFHMRDSDGVVRRAVGDSPINNGLWHYIVGVRDAFADENHIYVDGGLPEDTVDTPIYTGTFSSGTAVTIGAYTHPGYYFNGTLDEVAIYSTALTDTDMATCTFAPDVGDVAFEIDTGLIPELEIFPGQLLSNSSGAGTLSIDFVKGSSKKGGSIVGNPVIEPYTSYTYTPPALYEGTDLFTFSVSDGTNTATGSAVIDVIAPQFPEVTQPDDQFSNEGETITTLEIDATDPNGDEMTYVATNLPPGLTINENTGDIDGTVAYTATQGSPTKIFSVTVTVTDVPDGNATPVVFDWTITRVNMAPVLEDPGPQENHEGDVVDLQIEATDANEDPLTYGESGLPPGLGIDTSTGLISGTISGAIVSTYSVSVTVTDGEAPPEQVDFDWVITDENRAPEITTQPEDQVNTEGVTIEPLQIVASDPDGDTLEYSALGLPDGLTINTGNGEISGTIAVGANTLSPYNVTITVEDPDLLTDSASFAWTVNSQMKKLYLPLLTK